MITSLIAAIGRNNELGKGNTLVWDMPEDMKYFRNTTAGHPVIMGRKTFESIGRPMPKRRNVIITRDTNYQSAGVEVVHSLKEALDLFSPKDGQVKTSDEEIFIIGGGDIYKQSMQLADKLYITEIDAEDKDAEAFFPEINLDEWQEISREEHEPDEKNLFKYTFLVYEKI